MVKKTKKSGAAAMRHRIYWCVIRACIRPFLRMATGYTPQRAPDIKGPALVLSNHNTDLDPALVALSFRRQMYFVASEHIFRWGWVSRLLVHLFGPIPLTKGHRDARAALEIMRRLRAGQRVCVFAEGNRSVDGITAPISPATGVLAKAGADLITYRLEGGYFQHPRWARSTRRGRMRGHVIGHYPAADLREMSTDEVNAIIRRDLHEDAYARQRQSPVAFRGKNLAENLETALYLCPACGRVGLMKSEGDRLACACGLTAVYTEEGFLKGEGLPFDSVAAWYAWQRTRTNALIAAAGDGILFADADQRLYSVELCVRATLADEGEMTMSRTALRIGDHIFALDEIEDMAIVGQMTLTFSTKGGQHYEVKSGAPRSGYKYLDAYTALCAKDEPAKDESLKG